MDKVVPTPAEAVADVPDGASIAISGFGLSSGVPNSLLAAAARQGAKDLCLVANGVGGAAAEPLENPHVSKPLLAFLSPPNIDSAPRPPAPPGQTPVAVPPPRPP